MYEINYEKPERVHFIGIGGISMSGLAEILHKAGFVVSGSDTYLTRITKRLEDLGIKVYEGHSAENITEDIDFVVYSAAIHGDNAEYQKAEELGIPLLVRADLLGQIMKNYKTAIGVSGTHGKTTTTGMISELLIDGNLDPTISIGGILPSIGGNIRVGHSDAFVVEACEYTDSFLSFHPTIGVILNIELDHIDFFEDLDDIAQSFHEYAQLIPDWGTLIINRDANKFDKVVEGLPCSIITYSDQGSEADYTSDNVTINKRGCASFDAYEHGTFIGRFSLSAPGVHHVGNALASIACARLLDIDIETIKKSLANYSGAKRRFEYHGEVNGATVVDDFAHHPDEIEATLKVAKNLDNKEIWAVFQPYTYTRTKALMKEFAEVLSMADHTILAEIYPARETDDLGISSDDLCKMMKDMGCDVVTKPSFEAIEEEVKARVKPGDLVLTMGCGNIYIVAEALV